ncbi:MAG: ribonuclease H-like domain-containing protein [Desulfobulbaceae bacterium]|nr:ribonuclease H-like domain-containing protein [Desulfobulbaceae bacterium]
MLFNTFIHIPGIGATTERRLWQAGIHTWDDFKEPYPEFLPVQKIKLIMHHLEQSRRFLSSALVDFVKMVPISHRWRFFPHYRQSVAYLDIESNGLGFTDNIITCATIYDGTVVRTYVHGENMDDFITDLQDYEMLVTYNGKAFDLPMIERSFGVRLRQLHLDLRPLLQSLGFVGGLKKCEQQLGICRDGLDGVDGSFAVVLWHEYVCTGNRAALETLLAYNIQDTVNLESLLVQAYNLKLGDTPFADSHQLTLGDRPVTPYGPDRELVSRLLTALG